MSTNQDEGNNVIQFPNHKIVRDTADLNTEYLQLTKQRALENFSHSVVYDTIEVIEQEFDNYGIDTMTEEFQKDFSFLVEILRATIWRSSGLAHGLHDFIDTHVKEVTPEESKDEPVITVELESTPPQLTEASN